MQTVSAVLTWSHNQYLFDKTKLLEEYLWYAIQTIENGWSLSSLEYYVTTKTYERQTIGEKVSNYKVMLPQPQSSLAIETLKNPTIRSFAVTLSLNSKIMSLNRSMRESLISIFRQLTIYFGMNMTIPPLVSCFAKRGIS